MSQKFKFSDDQNTLIVVGGQFEGQYEATEQDGCASCSFWVGQKCELKTFSACVWTARKDEKSIIWIKAESKQDNKKATAIFSDNETVLKISGHSKHDGTYEAGENDTCYGCFFYQCTFDFMLGDRKCISSHRQDSKSIIWIKKEKVKMTEAPAPVEARAHAELIKQWASDKSLKVFVWYKNAWGDISEPAWYKSENYAVGHEKPTEPPVKMTEAPAPALQHRHFDLIVAWAKNPTQPVWFWNVNEWQKAVHLVWHMEHYAIGEKPTEPPVKMVKYDGGSIEFPEPARVKLESGKDYWQATIYGASKDYWSGHVADYERLETGLVQLTKEGAEKQSEALVELLKNHAQKWG